MGDTLFEVFVMFERMFRYFVEIVNRLLVALGQEPIDYLPTEETTEEKPL